MRALALVTMLTTIALMTMTVPGCTHVRGCKRDTLFVHLTLDAKSAKADQLAITVSIDGTAYVTRRSRTRPVR